MLKATVADSQEEIWAMVTGREQAPFSCPECRSEVILHKGRVRIHHFQHKPPFDCPYGDGESDLHRRAKLEIFEALRQDRACKKVGVEESIGGQVRPDVRAVIRGVPVAIEVQRSQLSEREISRRTIVYKELGVCVLWISPRPTPEDGQRCSPKVLEKYLHGLYFGRIHYWTGGANLVPIHFGDYQLYVEDSEWYEDDGTHRQEGGFYRRSKRYRTADHGPITTIVDCHRAQRQRFKEYPSALLWQSGSKSWWKSGQSRPPESDHGIGVVLDKIGLPLKCTGARGQADS